MDGGQENAPVRSALLGLAGSSLAARCRVVRGDGGSVLRPGVPGAPGHPALPACPCSSFCTFPAPRCGASGFNHLLPYVTLRLSMLNFTCGWGPMLCSPVSAASQALRASVPPGSDVSLGPTPTVGLILSPSAGRSSPGRPRSRAAGAALHQQSVPELRGETRRWSRPCSRGAGGPPHRNPPPVSGPTPRSVLCVGIKLRRIYTLSAVWMGF